MRLSKKLTEIRNILGMVFQISCIYGMSIVLLALLNSIQPLINLYYSSKIIDQVTQKDADTWKAILTAVVMIVINLVISLVRAVLDKVKNVQGRYTDDILKQRIAEKAMRLEYETLEKNSIRQLLVKAEKGYTSNGGIEYFCNDICNFCAGIITIGYSITRFIRIFQFRIDVAHGVIVSVISTIVLPIVVVLIILFSVYRTYQNSMKITKISYDFFEQNVKNNNGYSYYMNFMYDYRSGKDIRLYQLDQMICNGFHRSNKESNEIDSRRIKSVNKISVQTTLLNFCINAIAYIYIGWMAIAGAITVGSLVFYVGIFRQFTDALNGSVQLSNGINLRVQYIKNYLEFISISEKKQLVQEQLVLPEDFTVEFQHVSFHYPETSQKVLNDISVEFHAKDRIAIVGQNGSGKTTFVKLLCGFYQPDEGEIRINGRKIEEYDRVSYLNGLSAVFQDFELFSATIKENVSAGYESKENKVLHALELCGMAEKIKELADGIDTYMLNGMENGVELSGGEMQKVSNARAMYKDSRIMILDEPTAALDPRSEYEIYHNFNKISQDRLTIFISHRLSSCLFGNRILVFENGKIIEDGTHRDLLQLHGKYSELWYAQAQYYDVNQSLEESMEPC